MIKVHVADGPFRGQTVLVTVNGVIVDSALLIPGMTEAVRDEAKRQMAVVAQRWQARLEKDSTSDLTNRT